MTLAGFDTYIYAGLFGLFELLWFLCLYKLNTKAIQRPATSDISLPPSACNKIASTTPSLPRSSVGTRNMVAYTLHTVNGKTFLFFSLASLTLLLTPIGAAFTLKYTNISPIYTICLCFLIDICLWNRSMHYVFIGGLKEPIDYIYDSIKRTFTKFLRG